ncbi:MAG: TetR/AcrR family transcriptional regulator [Actinobacteria bacterium]|nr:TetR/AcrR family transcriptional regulator [Actinomycetota bacterium]
MVEAAQQLIRERGYHATAISDVLERSQAPRGSVYFHFPGGKAQLTIEAAEAHAHQQVQHIDHAAERADSPAGLIEAYVDLARDGMLASDYSRGCGVAPLITEAAGVAADQSTGQSAKQAADLAATGRRAFAAMIDRLAFHLVDLGLDPAPARQLADAVIAAVEGALITSRALRTPAPFDAIRNVLSTQAVTLTPKAPTRRSR